MSIEPGKDFTKQVGSVPVTISLGDLSACDVDAVLVPQFDGCASYGGVGGSIARAGALPGMAEFDAYARANDPLAFGTVLATESGGGTAGKLIHAVSAGAPSAEQFAVAHLSVRNALALAHEGGVRSLAIPALCTGIIGALTAEQSALAMLSGIQAYANAGGPAIDVRIVIFRDPETHATMVSVLDGGAHLDADVGQAGKGRMDAYDAAARYEADLHANMQVLGAVTPNR